MQVQNCCCCIGVRTGALILGIFCILGLLQELEEFYPLRMAANGLGAGAFILMILKDSEFRRRLFFYCFTISFIMCFAVGVFTTYSKLEQTKPWKTACDDIKNKDGGFASIHANNMEECHETIR